MIMPNRLEGFITFDTRCSIHNNSFSLQLLNVPNKLEGYITPRKKGLSGTNILA